jgi:hypothetical protein
MNRLKSGWDHLALLTAAASQALASHPAPGKEETSDANTAKVTCKKYESDTNAIARNRQIIGEG